MAGTTQASWWQVARWVYNVARNKHITEPTGAELVAMRTFLKAIWNPITQTGTRSWLDNSYRRKAVGSGATDRYQCNLDVEPTHVLVELVDLVGRDMRKQPVTDAELILVTALLAGVGNDAALGVTPYFGSVGGSIITIP